MKGPAPRQIREGVLRIEVGGLDPGRREALDDWLRRRRDVEGVRRDPRGPSLLVSYRPAVGSSAGELRQSLRDQLWILRQSPPLEPRVVHRLRARARFRVPSLPPSALSELAHQLSARSGVLSATASRSGSSIVVRFDPRRIGVGDLERMMREKLEAKSLPETPPRSREGAKTLFNSIVLGASFFRLLPRPLVVAAVAATAIPSARRAVRSLLQRRLGVDVLDFVAIGFSLMRKQEATAAFITWLLGIGDLLLDHTTDHARRAISGVLRLDIQEAWKLADDDTVLAIPADQLVKGDHIVVPEGARVPADGTVIEGGALLDEKALTGESEPKCRERGDLVMAASVVVEGRIIVEVDRSGRDTAAAKIVEILEGAGSKPMSLQRDSERLADRLVPPTIALATLASMVTAEFDRMTSVLITDFGTGIRITVPAIALTAMSLAARQGILIKGAQYLERMARADTIVFDKTGTLTGGTPEIFEVVPIGARSAREAILLAVAAEAMQRHPVVEALRRYAEKQGIAMPPPELVVQEYTVGMGLSANVAGRRVLVGRERLFLSRGIDVRRGAAVLSRHKRRRASSLLIAVDGELAAIAGYADEPRAESASVVERLTAGGRREIILMSGDTAERSAEVARRVGIRRVFSELLPEEKAAEVRRLRSRGRTVIMVGDGINDAPALALADVGISLGGATDVAMETADVVLFEGGLTRLPQTLDLADDAMARVRRGLYLVIVPNAACITLGALGWIGPAIAAVLNNGSTVAAALYGLFPLALGDARSERGVGIAKGSASSPLVATDMVVQRTTVNAPDHRSMLATRTKARSRRTGSG